MKFQTIIVSKTFVAHCFHGALLPSAKRLSKKETLAGKINGVRSRYLQFSKLLSIIKIKKRLESNEIKQNEYAYI